MLNSLIFNMKIKNWSSSQMKNTHLSGRTLFFKFLLIHSVCDFFTLWPCLRSRTKLHKATYTFFHPKWSKVLTQLEPHLFHILSCHQLINSFFTQNSLFSVFSWIVFGSNYSLEYFCVGCYKLGTPIFGWFLPIFFAKLHKLQQVGWGAMVHCNFQISPEIIILKVLLCSRLRPSLFLEQNYQCHLNG